jgi:hypothetical protein
MLHVQYIHLTKVKPTHKRQTHLLVREDVHKDYDCKGSIAPPPPQKKKKTLVIGLKGLGAKMN